MAPAVSIVCGTARLIKFRRELPDKLGKSCGDARECIAKLGLKG